MDERGHVERRRVPARCDGCGRSAEAAGMTDRGWAVSPLSAAVPGTYCLRCAAALQLLDWSLTCIDCGATVASEALAEQRGWLFYPDELGQLQPHCVLCAAERRRLDAG